MKRWLGLGGSLLLGATLAGCTGPQGAMGKPGADGSPGMNGTATPSVSAVTPPYAYLGRTVDVTIAGGGTAWSAATTVAFADPKVKVNKVTAASATGLLVNITVDAAATVAATDVTVTDGTATEVYHGAFEIKTPILVSTDQKGGVPQGGFAAVHAQMLDITTPLDPSTADIALSVTDVAEAGTPSVTDFALDTLVGADVLATAGESVDLVLSSGPAGDTVDSPAKAAFQVAARAPTVLTPAMGGSGMVTTGSDSTLYQFTPAAASTRFVQYDVASADMGGVACMVVPKSGKLADALSFFGVRFGRGVTSTDVTYLIVTDGGDPFANPPPYGFTLGVVETPCTGIAEQAGAHATSATAQAVTTLPALVQGDLVSGVLTPDDWYQVTVTGASVGTPKTIHVASGGDGLSDVSLDVIDTDGSTSHGSDAGDDYHKDVVSDGLTVNGAYFVKVSTGMSFDTAHSKYDLLIEIK